MDSNRIGKILELQALPHGYTISLHDFSRVGSNIVNTQDVLLLGFVYDHLGKGVRLVTVLRQGPLQWQEFTVVHFNTICAELFLGVVL